jgi:hypothetical protein
MPVPRTLWLLPVVALAALAGCGASSDPVAAPSTNPPAAPGTTALSRQSAGNEDPGTSGTEPPGTTDPPSSASTTAPPSPTVTTPNGVASGPAKSTTTTSTPGEVQVPAGTSTADKQWCAQAKPLSAALSNMFGLSPTQFQTLVDQANALLPNAPASLQPYLSTLHNTGGKFVAAVKAGKATISVEGVTAWANANLTLQEQNDFVAADATVTSYIERTC